VMKKFIVKFCISAIVVFLIFLLTDFLPKIERNPDNFVATLLDKHRRLDSLNGPRIILGGGSNVAFGLSSEKIEEQFNIPTINLGLHAGFGLDFILNELKQVMHEGDIVIISPEYQLELDGDYGLKKLASLYYPPAQTYYKQSPIHELEAIIDDSRKKLFRYVFERKKLPSKGVSIYSRSAFDVYGGINAPFLDSKNTVSDEKSILSYSFWDGIKQIREFSAYAKQKNIQVLFLYPPYPDSEFEPNKKVIEKLANDIVANSSTLVIGKPEDFVFNDRYFFDSIYHLNKVGKQKRTQKLIDALMQNKQALAMISQVQLRILKR
jgi:hypothetical protein